MCRHPPGADPFYEMAGGLGNVEKALNKSADKLINPQLPWNCQSLKNEKTTNKTHNPIDLNTGRLKNGTGKPKPAESSSGQI